MSEFSIQSLTGRVNSHSTAWKILSMLKNHPKIKVVSKHATRLRRVVFDKIALGIFHHHNGRQAFVSPPSLTSFSQQGKKKALLSSKEHDKDWAPYSFKLGVV